MMTTRKHCLLLATAVLLLTACGRDKSEPPAPTMREMTTAPVPAPSSPSYTMEGNAPTAAASQPAAVAGTREPNAEPAAKASNEVPMPGQNNDHSGPLMPASAASPR